MIRGGAWNDFPYMVSELSQEPAFNRSSKNGFRFSCDSKHLVRFERKSKLYALLKHPNIASIYSLEPAGVSSDAFG